MVSEQTVRQEELEVLRGSFDRFDQRGEGTLDQAELAALLESLHLSLEGHELDEAMALMDSDGDGRVELGELLEWLTVR